MLLKYFGVLDELLVDLHIQVVVLGLVGHGAVQGAGHQRLHNTRILHFIIVRVQCYWRWFLVSGQIN